LGFADLHIHSVHSHDGTCSIPAILKYAANHTDLDVIAITDHDKVTGLREAVSLGPKYGIEVIPGCEISTAQGHLLAFFIMDPVPAGLPLAETIKIVGRMGGLCVIPHPEAPGIGGLRTHVIHSVLADPEVARTLVGIETFNSGLFLTRSNLTAEALGCSLGLACLGSSDSHILASIGDGATEFAGRTAAELRIALEQHATTALNRHGMPGSEALRRWFPQFFLRKIGWVAWNAGPHDLTRYVRMKQAMGSISAEQKGMELL
jgi:predicted metal-dependent phosphoesterase TrpH